jgi:hypothetical protein
METLTGFKRAGTDLILTYHAKDAARWLQNWFTRLEIRDERIDSTAQSSAVLVESIPLSIDDSWYIMHPTNSHLLINDASKPGFYRLGGL